MALMAVTGAFSFSGRHIAARLLEAGHEVVNLTNHPDRLDPFGGRTRVRPLAFDEDALAADLSGVDTLFNTFGSGSHAARPTIGWRSPTRGYCSAPRRGWACDDIVHVSIANLEERPSDPYYAGKGEVERALRAAGPSWAILRPAVLFGDEPILVNSIAWLLRHLPVFLIPGDGRYGIQPAHVEDLADLAVAAAASNVNSVGDVAGPETFTFEEFVRLIRHEPAADRRCPRSVGVGPAGGTLAVTDPWRRAHHARGDEGADGRDPGQPPSRRRAAGASASGCMHRLRGWDDATCRKSGDICHWCSPRLTRASSSVQGVGDGWPPEAPSRLSSCGIRAGYSPDE